MRKKLLGVLLVGGAVAGLYAARKQIRAFWLDVRDRIAAMILELSIDDSDEDEEEPRRNIDLEKVEEAKAALAKGSWKVTDNEWAE